MKIRAFAQCVYQILFQSQPRKNGSKSYLTSGFVCDTTNDSLDALHPDFQFHYFGSPQSGVVMVMSHKKLPMPLFLSRRRKAQHPTPHIIDFDNLANAQKKTQQTKQICKQRKGQLYNWLFKTRCTDYKAEWVSKYYTLPPPLTLNSFSFPRHFAISVAPLINSRCPEYQGSGL